MGYSTDADIWPILNYPGVIAFNQLTIDQKNEIHKDFKKELTPLCLLYLVLH